MVRPRIRAVVFALLVGCLLRGAGSAGPRELIDFKIRDQFDRVHTEAGLRGRVVVILGSDQRGSRYSGAWAGALNESIAARIDPQLVTFVDIADLRGVPFFVKGSVKKKFPREPGSEVLLDWKGIFARSYAFQKDACTILLIDASGRLVRQTGQTEVDPGVVDELSREIERLAGHP